MVEDQAGCARRPVPDAGRKELRCGGAAKAEFWVDGTGDLKKRTVAMRGPLAPG